MPPDLKPLTKKIWSAEGWEDLGQYERERLVGWAMQLLEADAREALEAGTLGVRGEEHVSRTVSVVDERGWRELARIQDDALLASLDVVAESTERLNESGEEGMSVLFAMLCFEMATRSTGPI